MVLLGEKLILQYRFGVTTNAFLDEAEAFFSPWSMGLAGKRIGFLSVINSDLAPISPREMRERQRAFVNAALATPATLLAAVIVGESVTAMSMRSMARLFLLARKNMAIRATVEEAASTMSQHLDDPLYDNATILQALRGVIASAKQ
jgi:hypothetical protein